jgi:hypothetical protein
MHWNPNADKMGLWAVPLWRCPKLLLHTPEWSTVWQA